MRETPKCPAANGCNRTRDKFQRGRGFATPPRRARWKASAGRAASSELRPSEDRRWPCQAPGGRLPERSESRPAPQDGRSPPSLVQCLISGTWCQRRQGRPLKTTGLLGNIAGGFFEEFADEGLAGLGLLGGHAAKLAEQLRGDADGDELLGVSRGWAAKPAGAAQLGGGGFGNAGEVELAIRHRLCAPCGSLGALMVRMISLPCFTLRGV